MQKISNTKILPVLRSLLVLLLSAKIISLVVWWYLPSEGVELNVKKSYAPKYQRVDFKNMLLKAEVVQETKTQESSTSAFFSINSLLLKGLYGSRFNCFAIVAKKASPKKTTIVSVGETYACYKLKAIELSQVIFTKAGKEFVLVLVKSGNADYSKSVTRVVKNSSTEDISEAKVSRRDIKSYSKNPSSIWRDISIAPLKKQGEVVGFKINRIKKGSKMATLGLKKGDVIIRANNVKLSSSNDAIKLYKDINKLDTISIVVLRNNEEKEIIYEIH